MKCQTWNHYNKVVSVGLEMDCRDFATSHMTKKHVKCSSFDLDLTLQMRFVSSNLSHYNFSNERMRLKYFKYNLCPIRLHHVPLDLTDDWQFLFNAWIGRSTRRHVTCAFNAIQRVYKVLVIRELMLFWKGCLISLITCAHTRAHAHTSAHTHTYTRVNTHAAPRGVSIHCHVMTPFFVSATSARDIKLFFIHLIQNKLN